MTGDTEDGEINIEGKELGKAAQMSRQPEWGPGGMKPLGEL